MLFRSPENEEGIYVSKNNGEKFISFALDGSFSLRSKEREIGRASCRERVEISVVAVSLKKKIKKKN